MCVYGAMPRLPSTNKHIRPVEKYKQFYAQRIYLLSSQTFSNGDSIRSRTAGVATKQQLHATMWRGLLCIEVGMKIMYAMYEYISEHCMCGDSIYAAQSYEHVLVRSLDVRPTHHTIFSLSERVIECRVDSDYRLLTSASTYNTFYCFVHSKHRAHHAMVEGRYVCI